MTGCSCSCTAGVMRYLNTYSLPLTCKVCVGAIKAAWSQVVVSVIAVQPEAKENSCWAGHSAVLLIEQLPLLPQLLWSLRHCQAT
jgi:hypothetical protein